MPPPHGAALYNSAGFNDKFIIRISCAIRRRTRQDAFVVDLSADCPAKNIAIIDTTGYRATCIVKHCIRDDHFFPL